jgi:hypothetical protein
MIKKHLHLRKTPSPNARKLLLRKGPSTRLLLLRKITSPRKPSEEEPDGYVETTSEESESEDNSSNEYDDDSDGDDNGNGSGLEDESDYDSGIKVDWLESLEGWLGFPVPMAALDNHAASES